LVLLNFFGQGGDVYNINWLFSDLIISEKNCFGLRVQVLM
jgi:hypothetical protein